MTVVPRRWVHRVDPIADAARVDKVPLPWPADASYDDLAADFELLLDDVATLIDAEGAALDRLIGGPRSRPRVLDCTCGTGIQALGLAARGYRVAGSDVSPTMVERARRRAVERGLEVELRTTDVRRLPETWGRERFDVVLSSGHSIPLLADSARIAAAVRGMAAVARPGGLVVVGGRDYRVCRDRGEVVLGRSLMLSGEDGDVTPRPEWAFDLRLFGSAGVRVLHVFAAAAADGWQVRSFLKESVYLSAAEVVQLMTECGLRDPLAHDVAGGLPYDGGEWFLVAAIA